MRKIAIALGGIIFSLIMLVGTVKAAEKLAYVELGRIFNEYNKTKEYDKVLGDKENVYTAEREKMVNEIKQFQEKINLLSDKEKEAKTKDLETKIRTLQDFDKQKQTDLRKESSEKRAEIIKDIDSAIKQCAEKEGYTLIFSEAGVAYNAKNLDITDKIIDILNKDYKK